MMRESWKWVEAWIDSSSSTYVLLVRERLSGDIEIIDPQDRHTCIATFTDYEEALHWLNEDEYDLMEGRWIPLDAASA